MIAVILWVWCSLFWTAPQPQRVGYSFQVSDVYGVRVFRTCYSDSFTASPPVVPHVPGTPEHGWMAITENGTTAIRVATIDSAGAWRWSNVAAVRIGHPGGAGNMRDSLQACAGSWRTPTHILRGLLSVSWRLSVADSTPERFAILDQETVQANVLDILCAEWRKGFFHAPCRRGVHDTTWCPPR
jgi:hypothetical protein